jgi:hypothetical protein
MLNKPNIPKRWKAVIYANKRPKHKQKADSVDDHDKSAPWQAESIRAKNQLKRLEQLLLYRELFHKFKLNLMYTLDKLDFSMDAELKDYLCKMMDRITITFKDMTVGIRYFKKIRKLLLNLNILNIDIESFFNNTLRFKLSKEQVDRLNMIIFYTKIARHSKGSHATTPES